MGSCYSDDHIAEDHIHTNITCNVEEPQQNRSTTLERSVVDCCGWEWRWGRGRGLKHVLLDPNPRRMLLQWFETFRGLRKKRGFVHI